MKKSSAKNFCWFTARARGWDADFARNFTDYMDAIAKGKVEDVAQTFSTVKDLTGTEAMSWTALARFHRSEFL